jgi:hypothetical protein
VKRRCESEPFIAINDKVEMDARVFYIKRKMGVREQDSGETERERVLEREHCWTSGITSAIKIDCLRKHEVQM